MCLLEFSMVAFRLQRRAAILVAPIFAVIVPVASEVLPDALPVGALELPLAAGGGVHGCTQGEHSVEVMRRTLHKNKQ